MGRHAQAAGGRVRPSCRLEIEPGRYLVAESGYLLAEIRAVKQQGEQLVLPAGRRLQQPGPADPLRRLSSHVDRAAPTATRRARAGGDRGRPAVRVGRHLHPVRGRLRLPPPLPEAGVGELLVIEWAGAYGFVMGSNYNSRPLAAEVLIHDGRPHLVRRRQTFEDLVRGEVIPGLIGISGRAGAARKSIPKVRSSEPVGCR